VHSNTVNIPKVRPIFSKFMCYTICGQFRGYLFHKFVDGDVMKMLIRFQRDPGVTEGEVVLAKSSRVGITFDGLC
jgi:hypothetical protein